MDIPKDHENKDMCSKCGGKCCKRHSCCLFPCDLKTITKESLIKKIKEGFCFDYWEATPTDDKTNDGITAYWLRPKHKGKTDIIDAAWYGECIFLTDKGCKLSEKDRPSGGKAVIPTDINKGCPAIDGWGKHDCVIAWLPHNKLICEVIAELKGE